MIEHLSMRRGCVGPSERPSGDDGISQPYAVGLGRVGSCACSFGSQESHHYLP